jgi:tetratricopeptide (TPR) repeat protein
MRLAAVVLTICAAAWGSSPVAFADDASTGSRTILGTTNPLLSDGATALEQGRIDDGIRLTLEGLKQPSSVQDIAAGHANVCAGYAILKRWEDALTHCNKSIELDTRNWRAFNNRSAIFVAKGLYDQAIADVLTGLKLAPESRTLKKSLQVAYEHKRAKRDRSRSATSA